MNLIQVRFVELISNVTLKKKIYDLSYVTPKKEISHLLQQAKNMGSQITLVPAYS